jgi:hypothetical protein
LIVSKPSAAGSSQNALAEVEHRIITAAKEREETASQQKSMPPLQG